jgi:carboxymethylenebutenolidase
MTWIEISTTSTPIAAYMAFPDRDGASPGVVVLQEVFGVNGHIRDVVDRLAQMGYVAIAPALFHRQAPGFDAGYTPQDLELGRGYAGNTTAEQLLADIQGAIDYLKSLPQVLPNFGCVGFCFGGHVAYLAATLTDIKVTASFYGRGITTFTPGGGPPSVSRTADIKGKIYLFFGDEDQSIPPEHVEEVRAALQQHQILHQIWQYPGAGHGFNCDRRDSYNPTAATDAWQRLTELLLILKSGDAELASFS